MDSDALEKRFQFNPDKQVQFTAGNHSYEICFKTMTQRNVEHKTVRNIRRRPHHQVK